MSPAEIAEKLRAVGGVYSGRAADAERRRAAATAAGTAHQTRVAATAAVEVKLWRACQQACERGRLPMVVNAGVNPRLAPEMAEVERAAIAAGLTEFVQPDYGA